ncbi:MAG: P-type conjugative transfer protein VirB9 [Hyphomonadaceae bacterium]|nr:P-type conjugative transfer protein VirB9 [Hyphomonadaceae bacterium]
MTTEINFVPQGRARAAAPRRHRENGVAGDCDRSRQSGAGPSLWRVALALLFVIAAHAHSARADTTPRPGAADPRVRTVAFRHNDVVAIEGRYGFLTMIELSEDERIENVAIGDSLAWQVVPSRSAHMLFLKPVEQNAATNLAVVTNRRTYAFALSARAPTRGRNGAPTRDGVYRVVFRYPEEEARQAELAAARARMEAIARDREATAIATAAATPTDWNMDYRQRGDRGARPKAALDDGRFTYFQFAAQAEIPAIFAIEEDGAETLVNYLVKGPYVVIERLAPAWRLRAGDDAARIDNRRWRRDPSPGVITPPSPVRVRDEAAPAQRATSPTHPTPFGASQAAAPSRTRLPATTGTRR